MTSSVVDDAFFILKKCGSRALATRSIHCVCAILGQLNDLLANKLKGALLAKTASGPAKLLAAAPALPGAADAGGEFWHAGCAQWVALLQRMVEPRSGQLAAGQALRWHCVSAPMSFHSCNYPEAVSCILRFCKGGWNISSYNADPHLRSRARAHLHLHNADAAGALQAPQAQPLLLLPMSMPWPSTTSTLPRSTSASCARSWRGMRSASSRQPANRTGCAGAGPMHRCHG